jgi:hypothetical protein
MKGHLVLCCVLLCCLGCAWEGDNSTWDDFWKDLRGDNMQMRSNLGQTKTLDDHPLSTKTPN